jgi:hypothetical protein
MTHKALTEILTKYADVRQEGTRAEVPAGVELTLFVAFGDEGLVIDRIRAIELEGQYAVASTSRNDRYVFLYEDIRAVRFGGMNAGNPAGYER